MRKTSEMPLVRFLAKSGLGSRRYCDTLISEGRVQINGKPARVGSKINSVKDQVTVDGVPVMEPPEHLYILLNKPRGYLVSDSDPEGRPLARELLPDFNMRIFSVGRLDFQTEGAILFTNDGIWANSVAHPSRKAPKTYLAKVRGIPSKKTLDRWVSGIRDGKNFLKASSVTIEKTTRKNAWLRVVLTGGVNRQVRRMGIATGHPVVKLIRISIGNIALGDLPPGRFRYLTKREIREFGET